MVVEEGRLDEDVGRVAEGRREEARDAVRERSERAAADVANIVIYLSPNNN